MIFFCNYRRPLAHAKFTEIRRSTVNLLRSIAKWQQCFTEIGKRPQLMEKDYLVGMVSDSDIFGNAKARKFLNFTTGTGNILLLPRQSVVSKPPVTVSKLLYDRIQIFINPSEAEIRDSYQVMINSLSPKLFKKLYSARNWLLSEAWEPKLTISSAAATDQERRKKTISFADNDRLSDHLDSMGSVSSYDSPIIEVDIAAAAEAAVANVMRMDTIKESIIEVASTEKDSPSTQKKKSIIISTETEVSAKPRKGASFAQAKASDMDFGHMKIHERVKIMKINTGQLRDWYVEETSPEKTSRGEDSKARKGSIISPSSRDRRVGTGGSTRSEARNSVSTPVGSKR